MRIAEDLEQTPSEVWDMLDGDEVQLLSEETWRIDRSRRATDAPTRVPDLCSNAIGKSDSHGFARGIVIKLFSRNRNRS